MPTPQSIVILRAPQYNGDARLTSMIEIAASQTGDCYGTQKNLAIALLTLHMLVMDDRSSSSGTSGSIKSEKEGDLARSYGHATSVMEKHPDLGQTSYGLELLRLRKQSWLNPRNRTISGC